MKKPRASVSVPLTNPHHEYFAQRVAAGAPMQMAYLAAGYQTVNARQAAWRLRQRPEVRQRITELSAELAEQLKGYTLGSVKERVMALDDRWHRLNALIRARAADPLNAVCPGGETGLLVRKQKVLGNGAGTIAEFELDVGLLAEIREIEAQAARELGQWKRKVEVPGTFDLVERLNAGRLRVAEAARAREKERATVTVIGQQQS